MRTLIFILALGSSAIAAEGEHYIKGKANNGFTKLEAMKLLLSSDNKAEVYKCIRVEMSSKGTVKNK